MGSSIKVQTVKKRGILECIVRGAISNTWSVVAALQGAKDACFSSNFQKGRLMVSQSGSGQAGSFVIPIPGSEITQDNMFGLFQELIELAQAFISGAATGTPMVDDASLGSQMALYNAMVLDDSLAGVTEQQGDWSGLNFPSTSLT